VLPSSTTTTSRASGPIVWAATDARVSLIQRAELNAGTTTLTDGEFATDGQLAIVMLIQTSGDVRGDRANAAAGGYT
jgi:hypothetical protein